MQDIHGRCSRKISKASRWEPIEKVAEASEDLIQRETRLDTERVASKVSDKDWGDAMAKALADMKKLAGQ
jgi:hypothetical protein